MGDTIAGRMDVWLVIGVQSALLLLLQFGEAVMPSKFFARKCCHAGSGSLMLLLDSQDPVARGFVFLVVAVSLAMTWKVLPESVPKFRFGSDYDSGITIYLLIVAFWFCADPAGVVVGKFFIKHGLNVEW